MLRKPAQVLAVLIATTATAVSLTAIPAMAASWKPYRVYSTSAACHTAGKNITEPGWAEKYKCEWDSPGFLLSLYS
ncbi:hypothetical protein GCM10022419_047280 [Nonomuraea rosea]|uniref:Chitinase n=1 Tax=Nonomuraea rosea TaxID=638574 RepID=A0ABP6X6J5_9ACTN